jgi:hypothetical protein
MLTPGVKEPAPYYGERRMNAGVSASGKTRNLEAAR